MEVLVARLAALLAARAVGPRAGAAGSGATRGARLGGACRPRFMRREVRRAAWFLWIRPLAPALPRRFCARRSGLGRVARRRPRSAVAGGLDAGLQLGADALVALTRGVSFGRFRLIWLLMFAIARAATPERACPWTGSG